MNNETVSNKSSSSERKQPDSAYSSHQFISDKKFLESAREVHIRASAVGTRRDVREVLAMAGTGTIRCHVMPRPLAHVNEVLDELRHGLVSGRIVLTFS
jgi:D-arabinose 1-dehydrogenase-like Zn-dependent alcohol dehydrogenase